MRLLTLWKCSFSFMIFLNSPPPLWPAAIESSGRFHVSFPFSEKNKSSEQATTRRWQPATYLAGNQIKSSLLAHGRVAATTSWPTDCNDKIYVGGHDLRVNKQVLLLLEERDKRGRRNGISNGSRTSKISSMWWGFRNILENNVTTKRKKEIKCTAPIRRQTRTSRKATTVIYITASENSFNYKFGKSFFVL